MDLRSIGFRVLAGLWMSVSLAVGPNAAADNPAASGSPQAAGGAVPVVEVRPVMRFPAVLPPAEADSPQPRAPQPLGPERSAALAEQAFGGTAGETVHFSPREPFDASTGHLVLDHPASVDPVHGAAFAAERGGSAGVSLRLQPGRGYLVDFSVDSPEPGAYAVEAGDRQLELTDDVSAGHILLGLDAAAPGWITVRISRPGGSFRLHAVAVTPVAKPAEEPGQSDS